MKLAIGLTTLGVGTISILANVVSAQSGSGNLARLWEVLAERHDKDKDGKITATEYGRGADKFRNWDSDGDGVLTQTDFQNRRQGRGRGGRGGNRRGNRGRGRGTRGTGAHSNLILARFLTRPADGNKDGQVTAGEWKEFCRRLDCNRDGIVSREEFPFAKYLSDRRFGMLRRALDEDQDGSVQYREIAAVFRKLDRDKSKKLTGAEMGSNRSRGGRGNEAGVPQPGQLAPDFDLPLVDQPVGRPKGAKKEVTIKLSSFAGKKPVALIFGSYT